MRAIEAITDFLAGKPSVRRSSKWPAVRKAHLAIRPACEVCGTKKQLNVHHIFPVHLAPEGELEEKNLLTLCKEHHFWWGHYGSWRSFNKAVVQDAALWKLKISSRP